MKRYVRFHPRIALKVCYEVAKGRSLKKVCLDEGMPDRVTFLRWVNRHETLERRYLAALAMKADLKADEIDELADQEPPVSVSVIDGKTIERVDTSWISRQRLKIDTRKWTAATLAPKRYGNRMALTDGEGKPLATAPPIINIGFESGGPGSDPNSESDPSAKG